MLFGSDYPHPEGHPDPGRFFDDAGLTDEELRLVTRDNAAALLGLSSELTPERRRAGSTERTQGVRS